MLSGPVTSQGSKRRIGEQSCVSHGSWCPGFCTSSVSVGLVSERGSLAGLSLDVVILRTGMAAGLIAREVDGATLRF